MSKPLELDEKWVSRIVEQLSGLAFGAVNIVVHEGRIVQIDRHERKRFDASGSELPLKGGVGNGGASAAGEGAPQAPIA